MEKRLRSGVLGSLLFLAVGLFGVGCATIEGAGKDIEKAGEAISEAARNAKN
ncbi:MAG: entericidin, EcnA/B family [Oceanospirillaceae bacterium]|jgi:predicted small secreted protein|uniref:entericidin A/B family lipoprotein n=1 Tax=Marinobacterium litorale TaxID=404770 RepID=UPI00040607FA|nr:entericidin A/B family lipoprotein [Marinobacterium litorale]MBS99550.1 entericidin, EcnA/B family [Oceanospirillaceae bacterium]